MKYDFDQIVNRRGTYSTQWDYMEDRFGEKDLLPFSVSDTDFCAPVSVVEALKKQLSSQIFGYTRWNHEDFKGSIRGWYQRRFQMDLENEWVVYSPAVCYSISLLIQLKSQKGDQVVVLSPMYDAFVEVIRQNQRLLVPSPLKLCEGRFGIDFDLLEKQLSTAKILLLTNPHNPTGRVFTKNELEQLLRLCERHQVFLISDDIHMDLVYPPNQYLPVLSFTAFQKNCCICTSVSKTINTPGLTGSYLLIPDCQLRDQFLTLLKGRDALSSANIPGMYALMAAYQSAEDYVEQLVTYLQGNMQLMEQFFREQIPELELIRPEGTYLAWISASGLNMIDDEIQQRLIQVGKVGIMPGKTYGTDGYLRMNVGCPKSKLIEGLKRMKKSFYI